MLSIERHYKQQRLELLSSVIRMKKVNNNFVTDGQFRSYMQEKFRRMGYDVSRFDEQYEYAERLYYAQFLDFWYTENQAQSFLESVLKKTGGEKSFLV